MDAMTAYLSIGDFSRATHMSIKMLRHYHQIGLLEPADVDPHTGYRRYTADQIPTAQVIRRFRGLDMPLDEIQAVLATSDVQTRSERIAAHLSRLEAELGRTQHAVASLRDLLAAPSSDPIGAIELRSVPAVAAAAISQTVDAEECAMWLQGALGEIYASLTAQGLAANGHPGGIFDDDLYTDYRGRVTVFVPCGTTVHPTGRITALEVPAVELAVITHSGSPTEIDRAYGALATYVARHALAVRGPIRENYLVGQRETPDTCQWRTEIGWPIFQTGTVPREQANP
jgi:DNA-binding transcriptional MerR regulator